MVITLHWEEYYGRFIMHVSLTQELQRVIKIKVKKMDTIIYQANLFGKRSACEEYSVTPECNIFERAFSLSWKKDLAKPKLRQNSKAWPYSKNMHSHEI